MNQTGSFIVSEVTRINCNTAGLARTSALLDHFFMNCRVLPQAILAAGRAGSSSAPNCRKGNQGLDIKGCAWVTLLGTEATIDPGCSAPNLGHIL